METSFGKILTGNEGRDAFHQATIPLILDQEYCQPGGWVRKKKDSNTRVCGCSKTDKNCIGYIDPYIQEEFIPVGSKVYIFLNQGLVNDMRHHFTSPFFDDDDIVTDDKALILNKLEDVVDELYKSNEPVLSHIQIQAKEWLQKICKENRLDFEVFENATAISDLYNEVDVYFRMNMSGIDEDDIKEIYKQFCIYKNLEFNEEDDDIYYIDWDCLGC